MTVYPWTDQARYMAVNAPLDAFTEDERKRYIEMAYATATGNHVSVDDDGTQAIILQLACMMVRVAKARYVAGRMALSEADWWWKSGLTVKQMSEILGRDITSYGDGQHVIVTAKDYLMMPKPDDAHFKLINQRMVDGGYVVVELGRIARITKEFIYREIQRMATTRPVDGMGRTVPDPDMGKRATTLVQAITAMDEALRPKTVPMAAGEVPPCVRTGRKMMDGGENLFHLGRLTVAAYHNRKGATIEEIEQMFTGAPDYNRRETHKQVISVVTGGTDGKGYACPGCDRLRSTAICQPDGGCKDIVNPVQYGRHG